MFQDLLSVFASLRRPSGYRRAFLTRRQFEREIIGERMRASRRGIPFCMISLELQKVSKASDSTKLARLLLRNLRATDEKASFSWNEFAILLVDTPRFGGRSVVDRLSILFANCGLSVDMELRVHDPSAFEQDEFGSEEGGQSDSQWQEQTQPVALLEVSGQRTAWSESAGWDDNFKTNDERRGEPRRSQAFSISAPANEIVSSDDPLVQPAVISSLLKRGIDIFGAVVGLLLTGPFLLIAMAIIRLTSPGSAIFRQTREGRGGQPFTIYKLRTMVCDAESSQQSLRGLSHRDGPAFKIKSDPRVTKVGKFLRASCMDELPQFINVLRGDMSIVGPRPLPWHESRACSHWHRRRLDVRPGLTCFWQIDKASAETFDEWMRLDLEYVDRGNLWIDALLIYRTFAVALMGRGSH